MSTKRALTGGTGDVNPQYTSILVNESAASTFTQGTMPIPVLRGGFNGNGNNGRKYQVIELLKVIWSMSVGDGATGSSRTAVLTTSSQTAAVSWEDPDVVDRIQDSIVITTSGLYAPHRPEIHDFTDGAGHGLIIATENLFVGLVGTSQTNALNVRCRILYRFKNISVNEFVGLAIQQGG